MKKLFLYGFLLQAVSVMGMQPTHTMMHEKENQQQRLTQLFKEIQEINQTSISENPGNLLIQKASLVANAFFKSPLTEDTMQSMRYSFSKKIDDGLMPIFIFFKRLQRFRT